MSYRIKPICSVAGCDTKSQARRLCRKHGAYGTCSAAGCDTNAITAQGGVRLCRKHDSSKVLCIVAGCKTAVQANGLCHKHGAYGTCSAAGCDSNASTASGMCRAHGPLKPTCSAEGCTTAVRAQGQCYKHSAPIFCAAVGCHSKVRARRLCRKHDGTATATATATAPAPAPATARGRGRGRGRYTATAAVTDTNTDTDTEERQGAPVRAIALDLFVVANPKNAAQRSKSSARGARTDTPNKTPGPPGLKHFKHDFVKVEDRCGKYRPLWKEYPPDANGESTRPMLDFNSPPGTCPFAKRSNPTRVKTSPLQVRAESHVSCCWERSWFVRWCLRKRSANCVTCLRCVR